SIQARPLRAVATPFPYTTLFRSRGSAEPRHGLSPGHRLGLAAGAVRHGASQSLSRSDPRAVVSDTDDPAPPIARAGDPQRDLRRSEEHTSELQSRVDLVCRLLLG